MEKKKRKTGPKPKSLKIDDDWKQAVKRALGKKRPPEGWPKDDAKDKPAS
jgi:hypothetical protein